MLIGCPGTYLMVTPAAPRTVRNEVKRYCDRLQDSLSPAVVRAIALSAPSPEHRTLVQQWAGGEPHEHLDLIDELRASLPRTRNAEHAATVRALMAQIDEWVQNVLTEQADREDWDFAV